ncbi:hypothetical protein ABZ747_08775 [Kitasatospora cineracea]|uniref:hypothetical protein n=1 Tax=Kitasatospora cineracea TaxID=88074 RepID=UPI0033D49512
MSAEPTEAEALAWWETLPPEVRGRVDGLVLRFRPVTAMKVLLDEGRASHGIGLRQAEAIVGARCAHYGDRVDDPAKRPLDPQEAARRAAAVPEPVLAVEAVWDGDTVQGWFVDLLAVGETRDHRLLTVYRANGARHLGADGPAGAPVADPAGARPSAAAAADRLGRELAAALGVPFHFAAPDRPDDRAPRWQRPAAAGDEG